MSLPLDFLQTASRTTLEADELARLNEADKIEKQVRDLLRQWVLCRTRADLDRLLIENEALRSIGLDLRQETFDFGVEPIGAGTAADSAVQRVGDSVAAD